MTVKYSSEFNIFTILGIVFIILKLCKVIDWSWWWVLAPFWTPIAILIGFVLLTYLIVILGLLMGLLLGKKF